MSHVDSQKGALGLLAQELDRQANFLAFMDAFNLLAAVALVGPPSCSRFEPFAHQRPGLPPRNRTDPHQGPG